MGAALVVSFVVVVLFVAVTHSQHPVSTFNCETELLRMFILFNHWKSSTSHISQEMKYMINVTF